MLKYKRDISFILILLQEVPGRSHKPCFPYIQTSNLTQDSENLEVPVYFLQAKQGYTVRKM
jgi:hypothetical protein